MTAPLIIGALCRICGNIENLCVEEKDWELYNSPNRPYIQDIFPYLTAGERELLISGTCTKCWADIFGNFEEEE